MTNPSTDPFANTLGLMPRYMRIRMAAAAQVAAAPAVNAAPSWQDTAPRVDTATAELRRRIRAAGETSRQPQLAPLGLIGSVSALVSRFATVAPQGAFAGH
jgi:hypothetical protein